MRKLHVVLDTNIIVSAIVYGGNPKIILQLALDKKILAVISEPLKTELSSILVQKFQYTSDELHVFEKKMRKKFRSVRPNFELRVLKDIPDNRVLEAAAEGVCQVIVTGDKELLALKKYQEINIITASEFLRQFDTAVPTKTPTRGRGFEFESNAYPSTRPAKRDGAGFRARALISLPERKFFWVERPEIWQTLPSSHRF